MFSISDAIYDIELQADDISFNHLLLSYNQIQENEM